MKHKQKYYVVWVGRKTGIFNKWEDCKASVEGFERASYKSYDTYEEAEYAFKTPGYNFHQQKPESKPQKQYHHIPKEALYTSYQEQLRKEQIQNGANPFEHLPILDSLATDAACSGNPGVMEYQGVYVKTGKRLFYYKAPLGTNNIGEFLGIVHGLSYMKRHSYPQPLYTDSVNAIKWVKEKKCKTKLPLNDETKELYDYIHRAEEWLRNNTYTTKILKWDTDNWGEIPADFGRKK
ncbi:MAG: ribonuclease H family protein [Bacteroidales bacterium]|nr:ribonuclease H family protein [Bacteroidales bacterium]